MCYYCIVRPYTTFRFYVVKLLHDNVNMLTNVLNVSVSWLTFEFLVWYLKVSIFPPKATHLGTYISSASHQMLPNCGPTYIRTFCRSQPFAQFKWKPKSWNADFYYQNWHVRLSQRCWWAFKSNGMWRSVSDVSKDRSALSSGLSNQSLGLLDPEDKVITYTAKHRKHCVICHRNLMSMNNESDRPLNILNRQYS